MERRSIAVCDAAFVCTPAGVSPLIRARASSWAARSRNDGLQRVGRANIIAAHGSPGGRARERTRAVFARKSLKVADGDADTAEAEQKTAERGIGDIWPAYAALAGVQAIPFWSQDLSAYVVYFLVTASCSLVIGAKRNMLEPVVEQLSTKSAFLAPIVGSGFLFGVYLLIKYTSLDISVIYNVLASTFGVICLQQSLVPLVESALPPDVNAVDVSDDKRALSRDEIIAAALTLPVAALYALNVAPHYAFSNAIALGIAVQSLGLIKPGSFIVAASLLTGLFFYDCFWVFGSDVMVTVATKIDAPAKLLFPKAVSAATSAAAVSATGEMASAGSYPYAVLGLGDIVVPGVFAALMLTIDKEMVQRLNPNALVSVRSGPYFRAGVFAYIAGLGTCFVANSVTRAAQPALFYLVPAMLGASVLVAVSRKELPELLRFSSGARPEFGEKADEDAKS